MSHRNDAATSAKPSNPTTANSSGSGAHSRPRVALAAICIAAIIAAGASVVRNYREMNRPGAVDSDEGARALADGRPDLAEAAWRRGIHDDPADARCFSLLADYDFKQGKTAEAADLYAAVTRLTPNDGASFLKLYQAQSANRDQKGALASLKRATELLPNDGDAFGMYGLFAQARNDFPAAFPALQRAHALKPDDRDYLFGLIQLEMMRSDFESAARNLEPWMRLHPNDAQGCHLQALLLEQRPPTAENLAAALDLERRAHAGAPHNTDAIDGLGDVTLKLNRPAEAIPIFLQAATLDPDDEKARNGLLRCYQRLGRVSDAETMARTIATLEARRQRIAHLADAFSFHSNDVAVGLELAALYEAQDRFSSARDILSRLTAHAPDSTVARKSLADFLARHPASAPDDGAPLPNAKTSP